MEQGVVCFITAGSVDDGKSTLIGRLLYDTKSILVDQMESLSKTRHARVTSTEAGIDLALLTDGLEAEREQGITIDVAYRYFSTPQRKFIVADAPGHEQYTRNLVTGASQSDVAVILVDATRVDLSTQPATLLAQTKRHAAIIRLLGLRHVVFVINKMDLLDFSETTFNIIGEAITDLTQKLGLPKPQLIPISALLGINVVKKSTTTPWYKGETLLHWLEQLDLGVDKKSAELRFPVQFVARQDGSDANGFRGYMGRIDAGHVSVGQEITVLPNGQRSTITEIYLANGSGGLEAANTVPSAATGQAVTLCLSEELDVSRGDLFVMAEGQEPPTLTQQLCADLCWLDSEPLSLSRKYALRHTTNTVAAKVKRIQQVLDVHTLQHGTDVHALCANDIGRVELALQKPIAADLFDEARRTGCFILIDEVTNHTVAAGMIRST
jgi:sulfate adenylyltransferase subunit 1